MSGKAGKTVNEGAVKGGDGNYIFSLLDMEGIKTGQRYSSAVGPVVEGQRTQVGLMRKEKGTGAKPHSHPNEQWNYVVQGRLRVTVDDQGKHRWPRHIALFSAECGAFHRRVARRGCLFLRC